MYKFIFNKTWMSILTLFATVLIFYFLFVSYKGNPLDYNKYLALGPNGPAIYQQDLIRYHINEPVYVRFGIWISGIFQGDWGPTYNYLTDSTIPSLFFKPLKYSMYVFIPAYFIGMIFGVGLGYWAGYQRGKTVDTVINVFITLFIAIPSFILASLVLVGSSALNIPVLFQNPELPGVTTALFIKSLLPSIFVMVITSLAGWAYFLRNEVANILVSDYILAVRTKGFSEWTIFRKYVLRNSLYPFIGSIVTMYTVIFSSSMIVESFFNVPGTSTMFLQATKSGEINILMFSLLFFSATGLFSDIIASIAQFSINPLIRANFSSKPSPLKKGKAWYTRHKLRKKALTTNEVGRGLND